MTNNDRLVLRIKAIAENIDTVDSIVFHQILTMLKEDIKKGEYDD